jgi:small subunit ribosomal protein S5
MGLVDQAPARNMFKQYDSQEKAALAKKYTPEQIRSIEAGEEAIDPEDLKSHGRLRTDIGKLRYLDDFSVIRPVVDKRIKDNTPVDHNARWMNEEERLQEAAEWLDSFSDQPEPNNREDARPNRLDFMKFLEETTSRTGGGKRTASSLAPALPKIPELVGQFTSQKKGEEEDNRDEEGTYNRLRKATGMTLDDIFALKTKILVRHRVVNQTRLGKIQSMYILAVAGNGNGRLGIGEGKAQEMDEAMSKAKLAAIRNMQPIPRYEERTIFGEVEGKVSAAVVKLMARPPGKSGFVLKSSLWT